MQAADFDRLLNQMDQTNQSAFMRTNSVHVGQSSIHPTNRIVSIRGGGGKRPTFSSKSGLGRGPIPGSSSLMTQVIKEEDQ